MPSSWDDWIICVYINNNASLSASSGLLAFPGPEKIKIKLSSRSVMQPPTPHLTELSGKSFQGPSEYPIKFVLHQMQSFPFWFLLNKRQEPLGLTFHRDSKPLAIFQAASNHLKALILINQASFSSFQSSLEKILSFLASQIVHSNAINEVYQSSLSATHLRHLRSKKRSPWSVITFLFKLYQSRKIDQTFLTRLQFQNKCSFVSSSMSHRGQLGLNFSGTLLFKTLWTGRISCWYFQRNKEIFGGILKHQTFLQWLVKESSNPIMKLYPNLVE